MMPPMIMTMIVVALDMKMRVEPAGEGVEQSGWSETAEDIHEVVCLDVDRRTTQEDKKGDEGVEDTTVVPIE